MASPEWQEIYRSYDPEALTKEIADLTKQKSTLISQSVGNKSYTQDLAELKDQLHAAVRVQNERRCGTSGATNNRTGFADFSCN